MRPPSKVSNSEQSQIGAKNILTVPIRQTLGGGDLAVGTVDDLWEEATDCPFFRNL